MLNWYNQRDSFDDIIHNIVEMVYIHFYPTDNKYILNDIITNFLKRQIKNPKLIGFKFSIIFKVSEDYQYIYNVIISQNNKTVKSKDILVLNFNDLKLEIRKLLIINNLLTIGLEHDS